MVLVEGREGHLEVGVVLGTERHVPVLLELDEVVRHLTSGGLLLLADLAVTS